MPLQMNMKIDGVTGDSKSFKHKGWFDVLSWNWGMTSNRKTSKGADGEKTSLNELSIIKSIGNDSTDIRSLFAKGKIIPSVEFSILPAVAKREVQTKYLDIRLEDVVIKSIVTGGSSEDAFFKEHVTLLFDRVSFNFSQESARRVEDANDMSAGTGFNWNVTESMEWKH